MNQPTDCLINESDVILPESIYDSSRVRLCIHLLLFLANFFIGRCYWHWIESTFGILQPPIKISSIQSHDSSHLIRTCRRRRPWLDVTNSERNREWKLPLHPSQQNPIRMDWFVRHSRRNDDVHPYRVHLWYNRPKAYAFVFNHTVSERLGFDLLRYQHNHALFRAIVNGNGSGRLLRRRPFIYKRNRT